jgi:hypothetical protein
MSYVNPLLLPNLEAAKSLSLELIGPLGLDAALACLLAITTGLIALEP